MPDNEKFHIDIEPVIEEEAAKRSVSDLIYIVVWSGGYEAPSYGAHKTEKEAFKQAIDWQKNANEESDWIDVLAVDTKTMQVKRLEMKPWTKEGQV